MAESYSNLYGEGTLKPCFCSSRSETFNCNIFSMLLLLFWKDEISDSATLIDSVDAVYYNLHASVSQKKPTWVNELMNCNI